MMSEAPSGNVDEIYDQIRELARACMARYAADGARLYLLVEGNYGDYWQRTTQYFRRWPEFASITHPYVDGRDSAKFQTNNRNKATLCGHVRAAFAERRVFIDPEAYFWRGGLRTASDLHAALLSQLKNFYAYRLPAPDQSGEYKLRLTGKTRGAMDDMVVCLALLWELFGFSNREKK